MTVFKYLNKYMKTGEDLDFLLKFNLKTNINSKTKNNI